MSLLTTVQNACAAISLQQPSTVIGNTNAQVVTLLRMATYSGRDLAAAHPWQILTKRVTATGVAANAQTGQPPAAYDRFTPLQRIWDDNRNTWLIGPLSPDDWDNVLVQPQTAYPTYWTLLAGVLNIAPSPAITDSFVYSYISKYWVRPSGGTGATDSDVYAADTDSALIPEKLIEYEIIWRYKQSKGLDYAEDMTTSEREKDKVFARDRGPRIISTTSAFRGDPPANFWPGTITQV